MYIFKNALKNIAIFKTRNILMFIIVFIMSFLCCVSLIVWQAAKKYEKVNTAFMNISVDFGADLTRSDATTASVVYKDLGMSTNSKMPTDENSDTLENLYKFVDLGNPIAVYNIVSTHLVGSENFKSYILDFDSTHTKRKIAVAFSDKQYVAIMGHNPGESIEDMNTNFRLREGEMFDDEASEYQCIIDFNLANERNIETGDKIEVYLNDLKYELEVRGIFTSFNIENYIYNYIEQGLILEGNMPSFLNQPNYKSLYYFPSLYVNMSFYEEVQTKESVGTYLDFNIVGFPSDEAITDFITGDKSIAYGKVFDPLSEAYECVISESLANRNRVKVGDEIILRGNVENAQDYNIKVVGIYYDSLTERMRSNSYQNLSNTRKIPLDEIYMSYPALTKILNDIDGYHSGVYPKLFNLKLVFQKTQDLNSFYWKVKAQNNKMREKFASASKDTNAYFDQLTVVKRTTSYALVTFIIELVVAIVFLLMFNAFNMRERQYEIGVLTSMGMSKGKIALQFFSEIIIVVLAATLLGSGLGTLCSEPIGSYLTQQNVESREDKKIALIENFGREVNLQLSDIPDPKVDASIAHTTIIWLWAAFVIVTIISTSGTIFFILSFEPVAILNDR